MADKEEAEIVRTVFQMACAGSRASEISAHLNAAGSTRRSGRPWIARQVHDVLSRRDLYERRAVNYGAVDGLNAGLILLEKRAEKCAQSESWPLCKEEPKQRCSSKVANPR
jgi:hypothetical protein